MTDLPPPPSGDPLGQQPSTGDQPGYGDQPGTGDQPGYDGQPPTYQPAAAEPTPTPGPATAGYPTPGYPQVIEQPGYQPYGTPPKPKNKTLLWILGGVGLLVLLCCGGAIAIAFTKGDDKGRVDMASSPTATASGAVVTSPTASASAAAPGTPTPAASKTAAAPAGPHLGTLVRDGKFQFIVNSIDCSTTYLGTKPYGKPAQGQFCLVNLSVKNIGKSAQNLLGLAQKTYDAKGTEYSNDSGAEFFANQQATTFLTAINPGNSVRGLLVFDVPKGTKLTQIELHDSLFSGGVRVALR